MLWRIGYTIEVRLPASVELVRQRLNLQHVRPLKP